MSIPSKTSRLSISKIFDEDLQAFLEDGTE
jgi:hypothetical protein